MSREGPPGDLPKAPKKDIFGRFVPGSGRSTHEILANTEFTIDPFAGVSDVDATETDGHLVVQGEVNLIFIGAGAKVDLTKLNDEISSMSNDFNSDMDYVMP